MIIINPGSGPVPGATAGDARRNALALAEDLRAAGRTVEFGPGLPKGDGRWSFVFEVDGRRHDVEMPGLPLEQVRFIKEPGQNIWDFPRLYVDGSSWIWCFALNILVDRPDEEVPDPEPICIGCGKRPEELPEYVQAAEAENDYRASKGRTREVTPTSYVRFEEGTYNSENGHFLCNRCYIGAGMPTTPGGWKAP